MEIRLNKLISDTGLCSRREADKFIETGRVTVNGVLPQVGQKVSVQDIVMLDDIRVQMNKHATEHGRTAAGKTQELIFGRTAEKKAPNKPIARTSSPATEKSDGTKPSGSKGLRPGKYVKYNKYAAARKSAKEGTHEGEKNNKETKSNSLADPQQLREAMKPKFGKSIGRSAVAQRLGASAKSAALRKTSKNNPVNKAKRTDGQNKPKGE